MDRADAIARLAAERARLEALGVTHVYLFGSVARGEARDDSDVDVVVDLDEGPGGRYELFSAFDVCGIRIELRDILERRVDLIVRADALEPGRRLREVAERQLVDVF